MTIEVTHLLKDVQEEINILKDFGHSGDWFHTKEQEAALLVLVETLSLESKCIDLEAILKRKQEDFKKIDQWKKEVETAKSELRKSEAERRALGKANTRLSEELAKAQTTVDNQNKAFTQEEKNYEKKIQEANTKRVEVEEKYYNLQGAYTLAQTDCQRLQAQNANERGLVNELKTKFEALKKDLHNERSAREDLVKDHELLKKAYNKMAEDLVSARKESAQAEDRLIAVALNAKQIQLIIEKDLEIINGNTAKKKEPPDGTYNG
jgi:chromosome segregation ATPase